MMPRRAAAAKAATIAVGLARSSAEGQTTTSTVIAVSAARDWVYGSAERAMRNQTSAAMAIAMGTNACATFSMRSCLGERVFSASRMRFVTLPMVDCAPTPVTRMSMVPVRFVVPAYTSAPGWASAGTASPVSDAWLMLVSPLATMPSTGRFSPG